MFCEFQANILITVSFSFSHMRQYIRRKWWPVRNNGYVDRVLWARTVVTSYVGLWKKSKEEEPQSISFLWKISAVSRANVHINYDLIYFWWEYVVPVHFIWYQRSFALLRVRYIRWVHLFDNYIIIYKSK